MIQKLAPPQKRLLAGPVKYWVVLRTRVQNNLAYPLDLLGRTISILLFLWVFINLWQVTYRASGQEVIAGLSFGDTLWYLMMAEAVILSKSDLSRTISEAVKDGSIAYLLNKPFNFILYQFATGLGDSVLAFVVNVAAGGALVWWLVGPPPPVLGWPLVLVHVLASRSIPSGMGDIVYGLLSFVAGMVVVDGVDGFWVLRFLVVSFLAVIVFVSFLVVVQSLAFWIGNANLLVNNAVNAIITFALYPLTLFDGTAKLLLFTLIPAAFVGAVPAQFVRQFDWVSLLQLLAASTLFLALALVTFYGGLRRYESGSAIQVRM